MSNLNAPANTRSFPLADADQCVKCGLCLPHCPTYLQSGHEADSPRGRIALMQGLATGQVPLTSPLEVHLDGCLSCRACETVCPAKVPYGRLIDASRALMLEKRPRRSRVTKLIAYGLTHRRARHSIALLLWIYQRSGVQALVRRSGVLGKGRLARLDSLLPRISLPRRFPSPNHRPGQTALFVGCTGELADRQTLDDALILLDRIGVPVEVPEGQACCGALDQHHGNVSGAVRLAHQNLRAFDGASAILCSASGCAATLMEYPELISAEGAAFSARVQDIGGYLLTHWPENLGLAPLRARAAIHTPCTQKNVVKQSHAVRALLEKIPGLELLELDLSDGCCGAAGSYFITQPSMADALLKRKLDRVQELAPDYIVSSNVGCSMHIAAALRRQGLNVELLHPVTLLARQLAPAASPPPAKLQRD